MKSDAEVTAHSPCAGRTEPFPSGKLTFLSPRPLPTGFPSRDHGHVIGEVSDGYMDLGGDRPRVLAWEAMFGGPFSAS